MITKSWGVAAAMISTCCVGLAAMEVRHRRDRTIWVARLEDAQLAANTDAMTGLPNRAALMAVLEARICSGASWSLALTDVDHFKIINDTLGHGAGDEVLITIARRLTDSAGDQVMVARLGGDEFALVVPTAPEPTVKLMEHVARAVEVPQTARGLELQVGISIGIAGYTPGLNAVELMRRADTAMYCAKKQPGHSVTWAPHTTPPSHHDVGRRQSRDFAGTAAQ
ncbi:GGDEF domain-containing protein [Catellatospora methionotrophica]|uniref:GGDEF domain-containing protein n=1 Tax=Catellatospora methionotrophica TaxID=121620 RepID=UPI0033ECE398